MKRKITIYDPDNNGVRKELNFLIEKIGGIYYSSLKEFYDDYEDHVKPSKYNIEINITKVK